MWGLGASAVAVAIGVIIIARVGLLWCLDAAFRRNLSREGVDAINRQFGWSDEDDSRT